MNIPKYEELLDLAKQGLTLQAREKLVELREAALKLQEENLALRQQVIRLEAEANLSATVLFERGFYWVRANGDHDGSREGPFCQVCYDRDRKRVRLQHRSGPEGGWFCGACRNHF